MQLSLILPHSILERITKGCLTWLGEWSGPVNEMIRIYLLLDKTKQSKLGSLLGASLFKREIK